MRLFAAAFALSAGLSWSAQAQTLDRTTLHYWSFNEATEATWPQELPASIGSGVLRHTFTGATNFIGVALNAEPNYPAGRDFGVPARSGLANNGRQFTLSVPTTGYGAIVLSTATRRTAEGFTVQTVAYSVDGGRTFTDFGSISDLPVETYVVRQVDFSNVPGAANNPDFQVRFTVTGATNASGNNRWDNLKITGSRATVAAPQPSPIDPTPQPAPTPEPPVVQEPPPAQPTPEPTQPVVVEPEVDNVAVGTPVPVDAAVPEPETVTAVEVSVDGAPYTPVQSQVADGDYRAVVGPFPTAGVRTVCVRVRRAGGTVGQPTCTSVTIYDPALRAAGHVTGGGWVQTPAGERLSFGFVARTDNRGVAGGNFQANWREGPRGRPLAFRSTAIQSMTRQADGSVVINGTGSIDGGIQVPFSATVRSNPDRIALRIGTTVNVPDTPLGGGDVTIHR